jgi:hypothetical protein
MENKNGKYFVVDSFMLACALSYCTGQKYYKFDNEDHGKVYSFINDENFQKARNELWNIKTKYNNKL